MLASVLGVSAASDDLRAKPRGTKFECSEYIAFKFGVDAELEGPRWSRRSDGRERKGFAGVVVVVVVVKVIAKDGPRSG